MPLLTLIFHQYAMRQGQVARTSFSTIVSVDWNRDQLVGTPDRLKAALVPKSRDKYIEVFRDAVRTYRNASCMLTESCSGRTAAPASCSSSRNIFIIFLAKFF